jgi:hypothetical protein
MIYKNQTLISMEQQRIEEKKAKDRQMFIDGNICICIYMHVFCGRTICIYSYTYIHICIYI